MPLILKLDDTELTDRVAPKLLESKFNNQGVIRSFTITSSDCFKYLNSDLFQEVVCLGHGSRKSVGEFDADQLVRKIDDEFSACFLPSEKANFRHLYLISCEVGIGEEKKIFAQTVADKLFKKGFYNVQVHAVTSPQEKDALLYIQIALSPINFQLTGDMQGYLVSAKGQDELSVFEKEMNNLDNALSIERMMLKRSDLRKAKLELQFRKTELEKDLKRKFLDTSDPIGELLRPHNTFYPNASSRRPEKKLSQEQALIQIDQLIRTKTLLFAMLECTKPQHGIKKLFSRIKTTKKKSKLAIISELKRIRDEVGWQIGEDWWLPIRKNLAAFDDFPEEQAELKKIITDNDKQVKVTAPLHPQEDGFYVPRQRMLINQQTFSTQPYIPMPKEICNALTMINSRVGELKRDYDSYGWFRFFVGIKAYKANKLEQMAESIRTEFTMHNTNPNWLQFVEAGLKDKKLIQGYFFSHKTFDMLHELSEKHNTSRKPNHSH